MCVQDKHGADHRSSPVASSSVSSRHRDRLASSRGNHNNHHNNSDNNSSHHHSSSNSSSSHRNNDTAGGYSVRDWDTCRDRDRPTVSDCSTGDATPTSEDGAECDGRAEHNSTHPGGAVSLSAAISRISQPPVTILICHQHAASDYLCSGWVVCVHQPRSRLPVATQCSQRPAQPRGGRVPARLPRPVCGVAAAGAGRPAPAHPAHSFPVPAVQGAADRTRAGLARRARGEGDQQGGRGRQSDIQPRYHEGKKKTPQLQMISRVKLFCILGCFDAQLG